MFWALKSVSLNFSNIHRKPHLECARRFDLKRAQGIFKIQQVVYDKCRFVFPFDGGRNARIHYMDAGAVCFAVFADAGAGQVGRIKNVKRFVNVLHVTVIPPACPEREPGAAYFEVAFGEVLKPVF